MLIICKKKLLINKIAIVLVWPRGKKPPNIFRNLGMRL